METGKVKSHYSDFIVIRVAQDVDLAVNPADDPHNASQNYQDLAPDGIDSRWTWAQLNGAGAGVGFVDL